MPDERNETDGRRDTEVMLCPECMTENHPLADFCHKCGRPLSALAAMDPIKQIYAQGWIYRKAISGRTTPIVFWGMWLIFGPLVVVPVFLVLIAAFVRGGAALEDVITPGNLVAGALLAIYVAILYRVTKSYLRYRRRAPGHCETCGYSLRGLTEPRCPECGTRFYPEDAQSEQDEGADGGAGRSLEPADSRYVLGVGLCYVAVVFAIRLEDLFGSGPDGEATLFAVVLCIEAVSVALLVKAFRRLFRRADQGCSRVFWCTFAANIAFSTLVVFAPLRLL